MNQTHRISLKVALGLAVVLVATPFLAAEEAAKTVQLPAKDLDKKFFVNILPMNRDASVNVVADASQPKAKKGARVIPTGVIPRSIVAVEKGGNGLPLAAFVLGAAPAPGATVAGRDIAALCRTAAGKTECRVLVVPRDGKFGPFTTLAQIEAKDPGLTADLKEKFGPAKGEAQFTVKSRKETIRYVGDAIADFENSLIKESDKRPLDKNGNPQLYKWAGARNIGE